MNNNNLGLLSNDLKNGLNHTQLLLNFTKSFPSAPYKSFFEWMLTTCICIVYSFWVDAGIK